MLGGRPRQAWPESRMQDPGPCGAAGSACRDCRPIVATAWQLIGQKGCRAGAGNAAASPSRHRCFGKRAQRRPSTGSPGASAVSVRIYTQYTGIGDTVVIQGLLHDSLVSTYLVNLHEASQDQRASRDKLAARGCVAVTKLQCFTCWRRPVVSILSSDAAACSDVVIGFPIEMDPSEASMLLMWQSSCSSLTRTAI
jgi:hypothetical protein